jgi:peptidoglycan/LPS O-acetylase OafA/YrhL
MRRSAGLAGGEPRFHRGRVNELDLLRFIAALAVVLFHYTFRGHAADGMSKMPYPLLAPVSKYGYLGVELFFIISGFVILMTASSGNLRAFTVSRLVRLYPAFWACCTLTFLLRRAVLGPTATVSARVYAINLTMLSGFVHVPTVDGVYWSLSVELQFYALVAVVLALRKLHWAQTLLASWLSACVLLEYFPRPLLAYVLIAGYSAYFIAGCAFYLTWSQGPSLARLGLVVGAWLLALKQAMRPLADLESRFQTTMNPYAVVSIITAFFLVMLAVSLRLSGPLGRRPWLVLGALTYPVYLLHQKLGYMVFNLAYPAVNSHVLLIGTIAAVLGLAYAVHVFVEKRFSPPMKNWLNASAAAIERFATAVVRFPLRPPFGHP